MSEIKALLHKHTRLDRSVAAQHRVSAKPSSLGFKAATQQSDTQSCVSELQALRSTCLPPTAPILEKEKSISVGTGSRINLSLISSSNSSLTPHSSFHPPICAI